MEGRLIALCGVVGCGKTVTLRRLQQILREENRVTVAKSLSVEKNSIKLSTLISALFYDLVQDKAVQIPKQGERRERELQKLVKKGKRPVELFVDEAHDLNGHTLIGLKRQMEVVEDSGGRLSMILALEAGYFTGERPITAEWVDSVLSRKLDDLEPILTRHAY